MAKRVSARRVRSDFTYTVEEAAKALSLTQPTIRKWIKDDLPAINDQRPTLIIGSDLRDYVQKKQVSKRQRLKPGQLWCTSCKAPTQALGRIADYIPQSPKTGRLEALCEHCESLCCRFTSISGLPSLESILEIASKDKC